MFPLSSLSEAEKVFHEIAGSNLEVRILNPFGLPELQFPNFRWDYKTIRS